MHRGHDIAEQLELAHLPVAILVGAAFERTGKGPAQGATLLAVDRHLRRQFVLGDGADEGDIVEVILGELGDFRRRKVKLVGGDGRRLHLAEADAGSRRAPLHAARVTRIGDEDDLHPLLVRLLHPFEHFIVENALLGARSERQEFPEQEILVEPVGLVVTPLGLWLLAAMPCIGEDDGVAGLRLRRQIFPRGEDAAPCSPPH